MWDADFYVKVDDDVHVNIGKLYTLLPDNIKGLVKNFPILYVSNNGVGLFC